MYYVNVNHYVIHLQCIMNHFKNNHKIIEKKIFYSSEHGLYNCLFGYFITYIKFFYRHGIFGVFKMHL